MPRRGKYRSIAKNRIRAYKGIKRSRPYGSTGQRRKSIAAAIANAGKTKAGRRRMARKATRTRRRRGR